MLTTKPHYIYAEKDCNGYYLNQNYIKKIEWLENNEYRIFLDGEEEPYETTERMSDMDTCVHLGEDYEGADGAVISIDEAGNGIFVNGGFLEVNH